MPCLNCTSRILRIFLHDSLIPSLRPLSLRQPQLLFQRPVGVSTYSRLSSHLSTVRQQQQLRNQSSLATSELTDDDYVPFVYPAHLTVPSGEEGILNSGSHSGWPPPVPEVGGVIEEGGYECEPDIELTELYGAGEEEWWSEVEEAVVGEDGGEGVWDTMVQEGGEAPCGGWLLTRDGSWTLDSSPVVYRFHTGEGGKRPSVAAKKEKQRLEKMAKRASEKELEDVYDEATVADGVKSRPKKMVEKEEPKKRKKATDGKKEPSASKKTRKNAAQKGEEKKKALVKKSAEVTKDKKSLEKKASPQKLENSSTELGKEAASPPQHEKGIESPAKEPYRRKQVTIPREGESLGTGWKSRLDVVPDHWDLFPIKAETEKTRLEKFIASRPRNTIDRWMIEKANLQAKFKGANWTPLKKLSPEAQEAIRVLHKSYPEYTTPKLAEKFEVSPEAIRRILKSKWREAERSPENMKEWAERWERRGDSVWKRWVDMGVVQTKKMKKEWRRNGDVRFEGRNTGEEVNSVGEKKADVPKVNVGSFSSRIL